jgi:hypothetical protein
LIHDVSKDEWYLSIWHSVATDIRKLLTEWPRDYKRRENHEKNSVSSSGMWADFY